MNLGRLRKAPNIAIVGSTSPLGKELKEMIESSSFPVGKLIPVETEEYAGLLQEFAGELQITQILSPEIFADVDITFFACSPEILEAYAASGNPFPDLTIDLTQTRTDGTLFLSGVSNPSVLSGATFIVNPHPAAISACRVLSQLRRNFSVETAAITVLLPASERGVFGVDELQQQTVSLLNFQQIESSVFAGQIAFNLLPEIQASRRAESLIRSQLATLMGPQRPPAVAVVQAPVFHSHCFSMFVTLQENPALAELEQCLRDSRGTITFHSEQDSSPSPVSVVGSDTVHVARVEADPTDAGRYFLWFVSDNLRIAAHNALQIAESIILAPAL